MARKRKGRPIHGWLIIDKPKGVTSTAVVNKVRWALQAQKAGHGGTLDPLATGMLAIALGEATKTVSIAQESLKTYRFMVRLGQRTTTDDAEGEVTHSSDRRPSDIDITAALPAFTGDIEQIPPQFSAVKVEGERAYDLARDGIDLDLAPRPLYVEKLEITARPDPDHVELEMVCGKGGYVRSIARDFGEALGCHGHVADLRRIASGGFTLENAHDFEGMDDIRAAGTIPPLLPLQAGLGSLPEVTIKPDQAARLKNGNPVEIAYTNLNYGDQAWASLDGQAVAIVMYKAGTLHPSRVFLLD